MRAFWWSVAAAGWGLGVNIALQRGWLSQFPDFGVSALFIIPVLIFVYLAMTHETVRQYHYLVRKYRCMTMLIFIAVGAAIGVLAWYAIYKLPSQQPIEPIAHKEPSAGSNEPVGFLQLDRLDYQLGSKGGTGFVSDEAFTIQVWFTNRGAFPVYGAQVFALLITAPSREGNDARIHRFARKAVREEWEKTQGSQVAVGGSLYCRASVTLSQEDIDRLFSGQSKLYYLTFARWKTASGKRVLPQWDECSWFDPPQTRAFNRLKIDWRVCEAAPIPSQASPAQIREIDELREEGHQMIDAPAGHLPPTDKVSRWMEKAQLSLRTDIPEYLAEFDQAVKEPSPRNEPEAWFNDMERQVEGRRLASAVEFLDLIREELYSRLP